MVIYETPKGIIFTKTKTKVDKIHWIIKFINEIVSFRNQILDYYLEGLIISFGLEEAKISFANSSISSKFKLLNSVSNVRT